MALREREGTDSIAGRCSVDGGVGLLAFGGLLLLSHCDDGHVYCRTKVFV